MAALLTYGDTFELDRTPGVVWRVDDMRRLESAGRRRGETRARLRPLTIDGVDANYTTELRIGRSKRSGLLIDISLGKHTAEGYDPDGLLIWPTAKEDLTDAQRRALTDELSTFAFELPPLTDDEIREQMQRTAEHLGHRGARDAWETMPARFGTAERNDPTSDRGRILAAMSAEPDAWREFINTAAEAFVARLTTDLASY
ncbi:hypothetical protein [Agromyces bauzanensis]